MIAIDTNILVHAQGRAIGEHGRAFVVARALAAGPERWAIPWPCVHELFGVVANTRIWKRAASTPHQAWAPLESWFAAPGIALLDAPVDFGRTLAPTFTLHTRARVRGPIVHDARVAAICVAHGVKKLPGRDRDFSHFPELIVEDPFRRAGASA